MELESDRVKEIIRDGLNDFDLEEEDIPVLSPSGIFAAWMWTMRIGVIILVLLALLLLFGGTADAGSWDHPKDQPAVVFDASKHTMYFKVFRFYDAKFEVLCYANKTSMQCIPFHDLGPVAQERIRLIIEESMNHMQILPQHIFKIP